ncbi:MAG: hypothetical protein BM563_00230 [Bacteroidetes bacterium MedPE-SWsnd-G1]|nr:MAG: hypothetical protein BM563_00230 [Bacteroidetes bacterium MedPE-SWsnd-G1]
MKQLIITILAILMVAPLVFAQGITTHQFRRVEPQDMGEYLKRETTYWQKFAEQEVKKGNLTFWAILQKVGGVGQDHAPNILIVNTVNDVDTQLDWNSVGDLFPDKKMEDIGTNAISKNIATVFLKSEGNHIEIPNVDPDKHFNFVKIVYHNPTNTVKLLDFEANKWKPMVQKAMNEGKTVMTGWGNARILHPSNSKFQYTTQSYDLFANLNDALSQYFSEDMEMADDFFADIEDNESSPRSIGLYRIVSVVQASPEE